MSFQTLALVPLQTITATTTFEVSSNQRDFRLPTNPDARLFLNVTAEVDTSTLNIVIFANINGTSYVIGAFTLAEGITNEVITITNCPKDISITANFTGTSMDFEIFLTRA